MAYTCRVQILVEVDAEGKIIRENDVTGHYQLEIVDNHSDSQFNGKVAGIDYVNPVFSYGGKDGEQGYLSVFNSADHALVRPNKKYKLYSIDFQASNSAVNEFKPGLFLDFCNPFEPEFEPYFTKYEVTTGIFKTYTLREVNCFRAVAVWSQFLGNDTLWNIYEQNDTSNTYPDYIAWKMFDQYGDSWDYRGMWFNGVKQP